MNNPLLDQKSLNWWHKLLRPLRYSNQWIRQTPERALEEAYQAAIAIKNIEKDFFAGQKVSRDIKIYSPNILDCFISDIERNLNVIKFRIAEFKASRNLGQNLNELVLEKMRTIDEILARYESFQNLETNSIITENKYLLPQANSSNQKNTSLSAVDFLNRTFPDRVNQKNGALPRSIGRTFQKINTELDSHAEEKLIKVFRHSRQNTKSAIKFLILILVIPLLTQQISKILLIKPIVEHWRTDKNGQVFLNSEMKAEALAEIKIFTEELKFDEILYKNPPLSPEIQEKALDKKVEEIAQEYWHKGNDAISNIFADLVGVTAFSLVVLVNKSGWIACKIFMNNIVYDLSDSAKAFIIILFTDIFVGFHSPHGWEVLLEGIANHFGIVANHSLIFLFIATFPVFLDTVFKYWIFRYLNQVSPSAVATLKNMNE